MTGRVVLEVPAKPEYLLLARLDIPKSGLHRLRHTFATSYLQHGGGGCRSSVAGAWALADHYDDALSPSGDRGPTEATPAALDPQPISLKRVGRCPLDAALCFAEKIRSECSVRIRSEASERQETVP